MLLAGSFICLLLSGLVSRLIYFTRILALFSWPRTPFCVRLLNVCPEVFVSASRRRLSVSSHRHS